MSEVPFVLQVVFDCPSARLLAEFYRELLGYRYRSGDEPPATGEPDPRDWLVLVPEGADRGSGRGLAFQQVTDYVPPEWSTSVPSSEQIRRQMLHLDMGVPDFDSLVRQRDRAVGLGASILFDRSADDEEPLYVFADPAGHPFCIFVADPGPNENGGDADARILERSGDYVDFDGLFGD